MPRRRTGTIVRCGDHFRARITLPDGKRPWIDLPAGLSEAMARAKAAGLSELARTNSAVYVGRKHTTSGPQETVEQWSERWITSREARGLATFTNDRSRLRWHVWPVIGQLPMAEITRAHIEDVVDRLDAATRAGTMSWRTARNVWGLVTKAFADATNSKNRTLRARETNPALGVQGPDRGLIKSKVYLYPSEFLALVTCERVPRRWVHLFTLASYLYLRASELAALEWDDVDLEHESVHVHRSLDRDAASKATKGKAGRRVPITPALMPFLVRMREESTGSGRLVTMPPREELARRLRRYLNWAGVTRAELFANDATRKQLTFHDLRGTGITWLAIAGAEPLKIKTWAGHRNFSTTEGYIREAENVRPGFGDPFPSLAQVCGASSESSRETSNIGRGHPPCRTNKGDRGASPTGFEADTRDGAEQDRAADATIDSATIAPTAAPKCPDLRGEDESRTNERNPREALVAALADAVKAAAMAGDLATAQTAAKMLAELVGSGSPSEVVDVASERARTAGKPS